MNEVLESMRPTSSQRIYDLVKQAGVDVTPWHVSSKTRRPIEPSDNIHMNSQWTFGEEIKNDPFVACIWWRDLHIKDGQIVHEGNSKADANDWAKMQTDMRISGESENRLTKKINKGRVFDRLISIAKLRRKPIRVVVLDGDTPPFEAAAYESSTASKRKLDDAPWWVHSYDVWSGDYRLVREVPMPAEVAKDPFGGAEDPGDDEVFQSWLESLPISETEKDALIKVRIGQGWFREALIARWTSCAVTGCKDTSLLLASHIKPWRHCTTRAERLSPANGLLLSPNLDKAFDKGLITFDDSLRVVISSKLVLGAQLALNIMPGSQLRIRTFSDMKPFIEWHRQEIFQK